MLITLTVYSTLNYFVNGVHVIEITNRFVNIYETKLFLTAFYTQI